MIQPGQKVLVNKGALIKSIGNPREKTAGRNYVVTVRFVDDILRERRNYPDPNSGINFHDGYDVVDHEIVWAGSGGYWCRTSVQNVTPLPQEVIN